jgi:hypothetical protein
LIGVRFESWFYFDCDPFRIEAAFDCFPVVLPAAGATTGYETIIPFRDEKNPKKFVLILKCPYLNAIHVRFK